MKVYWNEDGEYPKDGEYPNFLLIEALYWDAVTYFITVEQFSEFYELTFEEACGIIDFGDKLVKSRRYIQLRDQPWR